jgi:hypothetical protein
MYMPSVTESSTSVLGKQGEETISWHQSGSLRPSKSFEQRIRLREAFVSLTRLGCGSPSFGSFGQELFDGLVSVAALTDFHQAGNMEFHPGFDLARRNPRM